MSGKEAALEQATLNLNNLKETLKFSELQFERIKSTIFKSSIWDEEMDEAILDFFDEFEEEEKEEMNFRYETAKSASTSTKELWNQCNKCVDFDLSKENMLSIFYSFIEYFEEFAKQFNNNEETEVLIHLRKTLEELKQT